VTIGDSLTQGMKVIDHAFHLVTIHGDAEVALLEVMKLCVELQNKCHTDAEELSLNRPPRLTCGLHRFPNDLVEFRGEGAKDLCHQEAIQSSPIDG
jgi:hypothetical protein